MADSNNVMSEALIQAFQEANIKYYPVVRTTPKEFFTSVNRARTEHPYGTFLGEYSLENYEEMECYSACDGKAGFALTKDHDIVSVFNNSDDRNVLPSLITTAMERGGKKLDNFNSTGLSEKYYDLSLKPVSSTPFKDEAAPKGWNYERDGRPDIYAWIIDCKDAVEMVKKITRHPHHDHVVQMFDTYGEAIRYRDNFIPAGQSESESENVPPSQ